MPQTSTKEYKIRHNYVGKVIRRELCKKFKFTVQTKESVLENETNKLQWDFAIETGHLIQARRLDIVEVHKKR